MTPTFTLYKIEAELSELVNARDLAIEEGALPAEIEAFDKAIGEYLSRESVKIDSYAGLVRQRLAYATECRKEADRLRERARALEQSVEAMKSSALRAMQAFNIKVFETASTKIERRANGGVQAMEIDPATPLPPEFCETDVVLSDSEWIEIRNILANNGFDPIRITIQMAHSKPRTEVIRTALKQGRIIEGVRLLECGEHVRIN